MEPPPESAIPEIIGLAICLVFSAFFSGTETALTALSHSRTQQLIDRGDRWSPILRAWLARPNRLLTTLLVGNNLVNILGSILAGRIAHFFLDSYADAAAVAAMTMIVLVFGEVTPKTYAKHNPDKVAIPALYFVRLFEAVFWPVAIVMTVFSKGLVRIFGGKTAADGPTVTEDDIEYMIEQAQKEGVFEEKGRGDLLTSALEFTEIIAKEIMIPRTQVHFLQVDTPIRAALEKVVVWGHSRVPVYGDNQDKLEGVLYAKDLIQVAFREPRAQKSLARVIRRSLLFVPETQHVSETLREMQRRRLHLGVVVDEFGGTAGLITIEDILEELVGEIRDEYDKEEEPLRQISDDHYVASAQISVFDLGEQLGVEFPDDGEYESLGGFLTSQLGRVPEIGATVDFDGLRMKVLAADPTSVQRVAIEVVEVAEETQDEERRSRDGG